MTTTMPMHPTLLRSTQTLSRSERVAAFMRGELARRLCRVSDLAEILNVSRYKAAKLWNGRSDYTLRQVMELAVAFDLDPFDFLLEVGKA